MIEITEAVKSAKTYLSEIYKDEQIQGLLLEETELSEDSNYWLITFSFYVKSKRPNDPFESFNSISGSIVGSKQRRIGDFEQQYKIFKINSTDGKCISMKIRNLNG